ncbi:MAG: FHA domain-containing protein [Planctomycetota bacterium]|nr:FHA domain-containing protein [Planctomycetota bacterium]
MPNVVAQNSDPATGAVLDAALRIGRGADNDVVLNHPTVSRHHAVIDRVNGEYFLKDLGSRNMTRVNGRMVRARLAINPGDKIRFGRVRLTFVLGNDAAATPLLEHAQDVAKQAGIVFDCVCGVRLWAKQQAVGGVVTCRKCHAKVVVPAESTNADSGETVSGLAFTAPPETLAAPVQTGTCSICQWKTNAEEQITACPTCGLTFHTECWTENCGCSAYGCAQVNALVPKHEVHELHADAPHAHDNHDLSRHRVPPVASPEPTRRVSVGHVMLAAAVAGGVLGLLMFGAPSGIALVTSLVALAKRPQVDQKKLLILSAGVSLLGAVAGACVSSMLWLGWSPGGAGVSP